MNLEDGIEIYYFIKDTGKAGKGYVQESRTYLISETDIVCKIQPPKVEQITKHRQCIIFEDL